MNIVVYTDSTMCRSVGACVTCRTFFSQLGVFFVAVCTPPMYDKLCKTRYVVSVWVFICAVNVCVCVVCFGVCFCACSYVCDRAVISWYMFLALLQTFTTSDGWASICKYMCEWNVCLFCKSTTIYNLTATVIFVCHIEKVSMCL